jgi:hypothetical protein
MRGLWCWLFHHKWWVTRVVGYFDAECWRSRCEEYHLDPGAGPDATRTVDPPRGGETPQFGRTWGLP